LRDRWILVLYSVIRGWHADFQQSGPKWGLARNKCGATGRAGLLRVVVREQRAFGGDAVDVGRSASHHAAMVGTDVPHAHIIAHDH
jgi:hypothetical protein